MLKLLKEQLPEVTLIGAGGILSGGDAAEMIGAIKGWIRTKTGWKNRRVRREGLAT